MTQDQANYQTAKRKMTVKQQVFINEYLKCFNSSEAARRAGYTGDANTVGPRLLASDHISREVEKYIETMALSVSDEFEKAIRGFTEKKKNRKSTCVYFIEAQNGLTKIGITKNVKSRLAELNTASPVELRLLFYFEAENASALESKLHKKFSEKRVKGEWFNLSKGDIDWIKGNYDTI